MKQPTVTALLLAAGRGSRLSAIAPPFSKTLLLINDMPVIAYSARAVAYSVTSIVVVTNPITADAVTSCVIEAIRDGSRMVPVATAMQYEPLGVAHALGIGLATITADQPVVVICGDNILEGRDIETVLQCVLTSRNAPVPIKLAWTYKEFDAATARRFAVWQPGLHRSGMLVEKPDIPPSRVCWCGPLAFHSSSQALERIARLPLSQRGEYEITDLLNTYLLADEAERFPLQGRWFDVGDPQSLAEVNAMMSHER